jgi:glucose/arabinose dehydrogenase
VLCCAAALVVSCRAEEDGVIASEKARFKTEVVADNLDSPWGMARLPDGRLIVTEREGTVRIFEVGKSGEVVSGFPELSVSGEGGLLDVEVDPDYAKNGWLYFTHTKSGPAGGNVTCVVRARIDGNRFKDVQNLFDPPSRDFVTHYIHYGGRMEFHDGKLFFSIGDRGDRATPSNSAQDLASARGKIHRINPDGSIPEDNPFVGKKGALPSIWTWGNRNAQGLREQPGTGAMWEAEHGPRGGDELNIIERGANYGWPLVTFGINDDGSTITDQTTAPGMKDSVLHWTPSIAVSGIDFYRGDAFPQWKGNLFAGSLRGEKLVRCELDKDNHVTHQEFLLEGSGRMRDVCCFDDGSIYVVYTQPGRIVRLVPAK